MKRGMKGKRGEDSVGRRGEERGEKLGMEKEGKRV